MAKFEYAIPGSYDYDEVLSYFHENLLDSSTASYEGESCYCAAGVRCTVRVYERYSLTGGNRVSLTLMLAGQGDTLFLSGITAAGGQGLAKIVGWGEEEFLSRLKYLAQQLTG